MESDNPQFNIDLFPRLTRAAEVAGRLGRFLLTAPEVHPYMSNHYRGAEEMLATIAPTPVQGQWEM